MSLIEGRKVQLEYDSGKGRQGVTVETAKRLDDNNWHSVIIERNLKESVLIVDRTEKGQIREPGGAARRMALTSNLFIGASKDYKNGFVGCVRALVLNGVLVDLVGEATKDHLGLYGISVGCSGKCSGSPCKNGGLCQEGYDHFSCDCRSTPFQGPICADEIGVNLGSNNMIKYNFQRESKSTITERIRIGFTTTNPDGFLVAAFAEASQEFLILSLTPEGNLKYEFDFGFGYQELLYDEQNLISGQFHDVIVERFDQGRKIRLIVDNHEPKIFNFEESLKIFGSADVKFNRIESLYIGRNETMKSGFTGCVSRIEFNDLIPLRLLFQDDPIANIRSSPETLKENFCGVEPITMPPEEDETRKPSRLDRDDNGDDFYDAANSALLGTTLSVVFIALLISAVAVGKYLNRQKGVYVTREDEGASDAYDADTAVLQGRTGHHVERKKEWFI